MAEFAKLLTNQKDAYFIGRQLDYLSVLEGALKLKEVSYVHADAYMAGELKHGPIALIEKDTVVIALATQPSVAQKTIFEYFRNGCSRSQGHFDCFTKPKYGRL